jgi:hypothetical protein
LPCTWLACSNSASRSPVAEPATRAHTAPSAVAKPTHSRALWFLRAQRFASIGETAFRSQHFGGKRLARIRVNPESEAAYRTLVVDSQFSQGTLVVEALSRNGGAEPDTYLGVELTRDGWRFFEANAKGEPEALDERDCRGCHAGAPSPPLFGPARDVPARESKR